MKKKSAKILISLLCIGIIQSVYMPYCYADEDSPSTINIDSDDDSSYVLVSDGEDGTDTTTNSDTNNNSSSNTTRQYTQEEKNALNTQENVRNSLEDIYRKIKQTSQYSTGKCFGEGHGNKIINFAYTQIPKYDAAAIINAYNTYANSLNANNKWVNWSSNPSITLAGNNGGTEYNNMPVNDRNIIKTGIVLNERGDEDSSRAHISEKVNSTLITRGNSVSNSDITIGMGASQLPVSINWKDPNNNKRRYVTIPNPKYPRQDAFSGVPSFVIPNNDYMNRIKPWVNQAEDENWPSTLNNNQPVYSTDPHRYTSAVLNDKMYIGLLTEYHIESATKNYVTNINYTSNQRRWTIYLNGEKVSEPLITDNPRHELDFTSVYREYGPGDYYVEAEQLATFTRSTYASYDVCEYLFDMKTGMILWFREQLVSGNQGKGVMLCTEDVNTPEWVSTGDTFTITVNDLGDIDTTDSTNRVD